MLGSRRLGSDTAIIGFLFISPLLFYFNWFSWFDTRLWTSGDGENSYLAYRVALIAAWRSFSLPFWNDGINLGLPLIGDPQVEALYPPNLLYLVLPFPVALNVLIMAHFGIAAVFSYLFLREIGLPRFASFIGAIVFAFCGAVDARRGHLSVQHTLAWLPFLFFAYERLTNTHAFRSICLLALALSLQFYAGFTQIWIYSVSALGFYALYSAARYRDKRLWLKEIALSGGVTLALVAAQAIPTAITAVAVGRVSIPYDSFVSYSFPIKHLRTLINPFFFGLAFPGTPVQFFSRPYSGGDNVTELACYAGALSLIAILALAFMKGRPKGTWFWMALGLMALLLSMGRYFPWFAALLFHVPVFNSFKVPSRFLFLFDFSAAVLVALCLSTIERKEFNPRTLKLGLRLYCVLAIAVTLSGLHRGYPYSVGPELWITPVVALAFLLTVECLAGRPRHLPVFKIVLGALVALDLWSFAFFNSNIFTTMKPTESRLAAVIRRLDPGGDYRILTAMGVNDDYSYDGLGNDRNMHQGIRALTGYTTFVPATFLEALRCDELGRLYDYGYLARNRDLLSALNTKWIIVNNQDRTDHRWRALAEAFGEPLTFEDHDIFTNPDAMRRVFAAGRVMHAPNDIIDGHNYRESAVVPDSIPEQHFEDAVAVSDIRATHGRIGATTRSAGPSYLVFSETHLRGWTARVDGEPVDVVKTNGLWMGVQVPPGNHRVEIMFEPGWFYFGCAVSGVTLLGVLGILITGRGKRRLQGLEPLKRLEAPSEEHGSDRESRPDRRQ